MNKEETIQKTVEFVKQELAEAEGGHDWWHIERVWKLARKLAQSEEVDWFVIELGALLHDIADSKFHGGDEEVGPRKAKEFLTSLEVEQGVVEHVVNIVRYISFKGGHQSKAFQSPELAVVQDADRLDALGAIGIARTFNYGGFKSRPIYDPNIRPNLNMSKEEYKKGGSPTINHFYEKLLRLKDRMNTQAGREMAERRHQVMENFLDEFYQEWEGSK